jgi:hypothetical protein
MINISEIDQNLILNVTLDEYLDSIGNILTIDILYASVITSITLLGTIFSILSIKIFFNGKFTQPFYIYYKIFSIISLLHLFFGFFYSICYSPRFVPQDYQPTCVFYGNMFASFHFFCFFYTGLLEVGILIDRIKIFNQKVKTIFKPGPKWISTIFFSISLIIGIMSLFIYKGTDLIWYNYEYVNSTWVLTQHSIYFFDSSDFAQTQIGKIYVDALSIILNVPLLLIIVILNIILVYLMRKHFRQTIAIFNIQSNKLLQRENTKRKVSLMAISLCSISIISRTIVLTDLIIFNIDSNSISLLLIALSDLFIFVNSGCLFFVCFIFNKIFKQQVFQVLKIQTTNDKSKITTIK